ncbi:biliverdin-producing heme oxygenase [Bradyrhizobium sp.]|uniref:biliverdin-producing heme oxygenase n=1 Tax=Bradyrhizobium sp. TaxID=376 RepID=UPI0039E674F9
MPTGTLNAQFEPSRVKRLIVATAGHDRHLDALSRAAEYLTSRERYGRFLRAQHHFHADVDALYRDPRLGRLIPHLADQPRLRAIEHDLLDLGLDPAEDMSVPQFDGAATIDVPTALGWLCVVEGSKLGAAFLLKLTKRLDLSESFGASHLAPASGQNGLDWTTFTDAVDAVQLSNIEELRVLAGARAAFARAQGLADELLPRIPST